MSDEIDYEKLAGVLEEDLAKALWLLRQYQRALYTLNAPDPTVGEARKLMAKYKVEPYKQSDGYRVTIETDDGNVLEISDPTNIEDFGGKKKFATDYQTGRTKLVESEEAQREAFEHTIRVCPEHAVPLGDDDSCHRCEVEHGSGHYYED